MPKRKRLKSKTPLWFEKGWREDKRNIQKKPWNFKKLPERRLDTGEIHLFAMNHPELLRKAGIRQITETENNFKITYVDNTVQWLPKSYLKK